VFEITSAPFSEVRALLDEYSSKCAGIWSQLAIESAHEIENRPFIQLARDELSGDEVDNILSYADIPLFNGPIGLPFNFDPLTLGKGPNEWLLFPLDGLEAHLRNVAREIVLAFDNHGSMDAFAEWRGTEMSAREYLVTGVLECIRFCERQQEALVIHW
jgi:hypothetical protein